ncbi:MAG: porin, partial [Nereida ignava]
MKNILFATTALVATAGIASADVSLSGSANVGLINNGTAGAATDMYQNISITAAMTGATDGGLTFGASLTTRNGDDVDLDVGDLGANASNIKALSDTSFGNIYVSGDFGTLTFDRDGIDNVHND